MCSIDGCRREAHAKTLCPKHYQRRRRLTDESNTHSWASTPLGPCRCEAPIIMACGMFPDAYMCQRCGRPPAFSLSRKEPT